MAFCHGPIDRVLEIQVSERTAWSGDVSGGTIVVDAEELFGGEKREGGVKGAVELAMGAPNQTANPYLQKYLGPNIPAFKGVFSMILKDVYLGMNPYLKKWAIKAQRLHVRGSQGQPQWYPEKVAIDGVDMNPIHIIRECLTDPDWGMGHPEADINDDMFRACADTLYNEGFGMSLLWSRQGPIEEFIGEITRHIDASLRVSRTTGKFEIKLIRDDFIIGDLPVLNENNIDKITDFIRPTIAELTNSVTVQYWDRTTTKNASITVQDIALAQQQGAVVATSIQYPGVTKGDLAAKLAARDLKALSTPIIACNALCDRRVAARFNPGDAFVLSWPDYGVESTVMRVVGVKLGTETDQRVTLEMAQDVFALSNAMYAPPPPSGWVDPITDPQPSPERMMLSAPYIECVQLIGDDRASKLGQHDTYLIAVGTRPSDDTIGGTLHTSVDSNPYIKTASMHFSPKGVTRTALTANPEDVTVQLDGSDIDEITAGSLLQIGEELARIDAITDAGLATIARGCADTVPAAHPSGTTWWFWDYLNGTDSGLRLEGESVDVKVTPRTPRGELKLDLAPVDSVVMTNRQFKPYPPANVTLNGDHFPARAISPLNLKWAHRNRIQQSQNMIPWKSPSVTPESGVEYALALSDSAGTNFRNFTGIFADAYDMSTITDKLPNPVTINLKSVRDGEDCLQPVEFDTQVVGYDYSYDVSYGGLKKAGSVLGPQPALVDYEFTLEWVYGFIGVNPTTGDLWSWGRIMPTGSTFKMDVLFRTRPDGVTLMYEKPGGAPPTNYEFIFVGDWLVANNMGQWTWRIRHDGALDKPRGDWSEHRSTNKYGYFTPPVAIGTDMYQLQSSIGTSTCKLWKSSDYGANWAQVRDTFLSTSLEWMRVIDGEFYAFGKCSKDSAPILYSADGVVWEGLRFDNIITPLPSGNYCEIGELTKFGAHIVATVLVNAGAQKGYYIISSSDKGQTWVRRYGVAHDASPSSFRRVIAFKGRVYAYFQGGVMHSADLVNWVQQGLGAGRLVNRCIVAGDTLYNSCYYANAEDFFRVEATTNGASYTRMTLDLTGGVPPGSAAVTDVQAHQAGDITSNHSIPTPSGQAGSLIIAAIMFRDRNSPPTPPTGFTAVGTYFNIAPSEAYNQHVMIVRKVRAISEPATITFNNANPSQRFAVMAVGTQNTTSIGAIASNEGTGSATVASSNNNPTLYFATFLHGTTSATISGANAVGLTSGSLFKLYAAYSATGGTATFASSDDGNTASPPTSGAIAIELVS